MRALLVALTLSCFMAASGCGTVGNVLGPREYPHVYGGVEFDCLALQSTWSQSKADVPKTTTPAADFGKALLLTGLIAVDFPLCFVGDTITLPTVLLQPGFR